MPPHEPENRGGDQLPSERSWNGPVTGPQFYGQAGVPEPWRHGPAGHRHRPGPPPHHARHSHFPPPLGGGGSGDDRFSGRAAQVLGTMMSSEVTNWALRSVSFGPPEITAIFKVQIAAIDAELARRRSHGIEVPWFDPEDIQKGEETLGAMSATMTANETAACLHNLFRGPDEVQAIAFLTLVTLRLIASNPAERGDDQHEEV